VVWRVTMPASLLAAWAGAPTESAVTRVTKVAETPNPSFSAEVTQVTQRPTTRFPRKPVDDQYSNPGNPSNTQNVECPTSPEVAADPAWWRGFSEEPAAIREIVRAAGRQSFARGRPRPLRTLMSIRA
jgi:hypothetical protein